MKSWSTFNRNDDDDDDDNTEGGVEATRAPRVSSPRATRRDNYVET